jgi:hypothetical protein
MSRKVAERKSGLAYREARIRVRAFTRQEHEHFEALCRAITLDRVDKPAVIIGVLAVYS